MQNMSTGKSALGMDGNVTALIGYLIGIVALVLVFIEKDNKFVRFHALQSVFWSLACAAAMIALVVVGGALTWIVGVASGTLAFLTGGVIGLLYLIVIIGLVGGLIYAAIKSYGGQQFKLPFVGNFAEKFV